MQHDHYPDSYLKGILNRMRSIALVGASANPSRPSFLVMKFLVQEGYEVDPVNPGIAGRELHGRRVFARLADVPGPIDMIDIFRNAAAIAGLTDEILRLDPLPQVVWMQLGIRNDAAARRLEAAGIDVVMDRCTKIEHARLFG